MVKKLLLLLLWGCCAWGHNSERSPVPTGTMARLGKFLTDSINKTDGLPQATSPDDLPRTASSSIALKRHRFALAELLNSDHSQLSAGGRARLADLCRQLRAVPPTRINIGSYGGGENWTAAGQMVKNYLIGQGIDPHIINVRTGTNTEHCVAMARRCPSLEGWLDIDVINGR